MGGFPLNGKAKQDFVLFKGCYIGPKERVLALGKRLLTHTKKRAFIWGKLQNGIFLSSIQLLYLLAGLMVNGIWYILG